MLNVEVMDDHIQEDCYMSLLSVLHNSRCANNILVYAVDLSVFLVCSMFKFLLPHDNRLISCTFFEGTAQFDGCRSHHSLYHGSFGILILSLWR